MKKTAALLLIAALLGGCGMYRRRMANRPPFKRLSPPIAYEMIRDNPDMLILDLRPPQEFNGATGHIRRAKNIPVDRLPFRLLEVAPFQEDTVLVYCGAGDCGERGIAVLQASGFENAILMDGGIDRWIDEGFKTVLPQSVANPPARPGDAEGPVRPVRPGENDPKLEVPVGTPPPRVLPRRDKSATNSPSNQGDSL